LGAVLGPWILFVIVGAQNGAPKWNPKQGPKYDVTQHQISSAPSNDIQVSLLVKVNWLFCG